MCSQVFLGLKMPNIHSLLLLVLHQHRFLLGLHMPHSSRLLATTGTDALAQRWAKASARRRVFVPVVANNQDGLIIVNPTNQEESHGSCVSF